MIRANARIQMKSKALRGWLWSARPAFKRRQLALLALLERQKRTMRRGEMHRGYRTKPNRD